MIRHSAIITATVLALILGAQTAHADGMPKSFTDKTVPVLVKVNSEGKVTQIAPAIQLRPQFRKLARQSAQAMITGPAMYHGRPVASQLVMFMQPRATARADGRYDIRFTSVKNQPVPSGMWYWVIEDGRRLALASESDRQRARSAYSRYRPGMHAHANRPTMRPAVSSRPNPSPGSQYSPQAGGGRDFRPSVK